MKKNILYKFTFLIIANYKNFLMNFYLINILYNAREIFPEFFCSLFNIMFEYLIT